jgi:indole-3-glycerol phosphate synthase
MTILEEITAYKREQEVPALLAQVSLAEMEAAAASAPPPLDFAGRLKRAPGVALIAEVKKASPSRGLLRADFDPVRLASAYAAAGAAAISVLTDVSYFQGSLNNLRLVRAACPDTPLLRKDFIVHPIQVYEARSVGADAILLIAGVLADSELVELLEVVQESGMQALVEVHHQDELDRILPLGPKVVGVNNRNLHDFSVDLNICLRLRPQVPGNICFVAESGIHTKEDMACLQQGGVNAALVGEALVTAPNVKLSIKELLS